MGYAAAKNHLRRTALLRREGRAGLLRGLQVQPLDRDAGRSMGRRRQAI